MDEFELDLTDPSVRRDPYPHYARLREGPRVVRSRSLSAGSMLGGGGHAYVVHRFDDVRRAFADAERLSSSRMLAAVTGGSGSSDPGADGGAPTFLEVLATDPEVSAFL